MTLLVSANQLVKLQRLKAYQLSSTRLLGEIWDVALPRDIKRCLSFKESNGMANDGGGKRTDLLFKDICYEGPFGSLSLRLKRVSITTAALSLIGVPLIVALHGGDVPATGQIAVGGTAVFAATGSTFALSYCFSPYVHTLERVSAGDSGLAIEKGDKLDELKSQLKATTRNILAMKVETIFDPAKDVEWPSNNRPFCNFVVKGVPLYVHPEMVYDEKLRTQLLGEVKEEQPGQSNKNDDEFL